MTIETITTQPTPRMGLPYPGLRAFNRDEADLFFGRDDCINAMMDKLADTRFLAVLGASGAGKSSLVRTGLIDALELGLHPKVGGPWRVASFNPGRQPQRNLARALLKIEQAQPEEFEIDVLEMAIRRGPRSVVEWVLAGNVPIGSNLLIVVDQFEELFRFRDYAGREDTEALVALLLASSTSEASIHIVTTMRSEFLGVCSLMPGLAEATSNGMYIAPRMSRSECAEAITGPALVRRFKVDPTLVSHLLNDLAKFAPWEGGENVDPAEQLSHQADQLPLMQHVLNRLWERTKPDEDGQITLRPADYEAIGGLTGALDAHGKEVMAALIEAHGPSIEPSIGRVFRALVDGSSLGLAIRRPRLLVALAEETAVDPAQVEAVVQAFSAAGCNFLRTSETIVDGEVVVDISHESLIRRWSDLATWFKAEATAGATWRALIAAAKTHEADPREVLSRRSLSGYLEWWDREQPVASRVARHGGDFELGKRFLDDSQKLGRRERFRSRAYLVAIFIPVVVALGMAWESYVSQRSYSEAYTKIQSELQTIIVGTCSQRLTPNTRPFQFCVQALQNDANTLISNKGIVAPSFGGVKSPALTPTLPSKTDAY